MPVIYFLMIVSLFPLGLGPETSILTRIAPAIIWIAVVLALLMSLENNFRLDYQEGTLEQFILSPKPLTMLLLVKAIAHWVAIGIPLLILTPVVGFWFNLSLNEISVLMLTLVIGIPLVSLVGNLGVVLTIGLHRGGLLLSVLVLPLMIPILIFATSAVTKVNLGQPYYPEILLLLALLVLAIGFIPMALAAALKVSLE